MSYNAFQAGSSACGRGRCRLCWDEAEAFSLAVSHQVGYGEWEKEGHIWRKSEDCTGVSAVPSPLQRIYADHRRVVPLMHE